MSFIQTDFNISKVKYEPVSAVGSNTQQSSQSIVKMNTFQGIKKLETSTLSIADENTVKQVQKALKAMQGPDTSFEMAVHEKTNAIMIKVINKETGEIIREVPPEKTLDIVAKFMEINGILVDKKV